MVVVASAGASDGAGAGGFAAAARGFLLVAASCCDCRATISLLFRLLFLVTATGTSLDILLQHRLILDAHTYCSCSLSSALLFSLGSLVALP